MIREDRIKSNFIRLSHFDSETFHEKEIGKFLTEKLKDLGLEVRTDTTNEEFLKKHPDSHPNIYGFLKGNTKSESILFSSHMDTVAPGKNKKVIIDESGSIHSKGDTVLGADDISGITAILEALNVIKEENLLHPDIEVLITSSEEAFCEGSKFLKEEILKSKKAYVLDLSGPIGRAAVSAPAIISFEIEVEGLAAHAGFEPEKGINALNIAVSALAKIPTGRVEADTTVNVGTIEGGTGKNIVPEKIRLTGEVRSLQTEKANRKVEEIEEIFKAEALKAGGKIKITKTEHIKAFRRKETDAVVHNFLRACQKNRIHSQLITTFGGSDANRLNEWGIQTIVSACGMEDVHTTREHSHVNEIKKAAELVLKLMTVQEAKND